MLPSKPSICNVCKLGEQTTRLLPLGAAAQLLYGFVSQDIPRYCRWRGHVLPSICWQRAADNVEVVEPAACCQSPGDMLACSLSDCVQLAALVAGVT